VKEMARKRSRRESGARTQKANGSRKSPNGEVREERKGRAKKKIAQPTF